MLHDIVDHLDRLLDTADTPDYSGALNGLQVENRRRIVRVAVAVDASLAAIDGAVAAGATLLIVHHGLFWSGITPIRGTTYERLSRLFANDVAVYSSHLPLDRHHELGNYALSARWLGLTPRASRSPAFNRSLWAWPATRMLPTAELATQLESFAKEAGGRTTTIGVTEGRRTRRWALCTGAGASSETLREARQLGVDTLIVGEGPHHTGVEALDLGISVIYAGHYATETLGVRALGRELEQVFGLPWTVIPAPTGL